MGFLILDTDKQSTSSLRLQLGAISRIPVHDVKDTQAFTRLLGRRIPPPEVIFLDEDGDTEKVASFRAEIEFTGASSIVVILGSARKSRLTRTYDTYLQKPVFHRKLEKALMDSHALGQQQHAAVGFIGESVPAGLVREVGRAPELWREIGRVDTVSTNVRALGRLGVVFVMPGQLSRTDLAMVYRIYRYTQAFRITVVGVGKSPEETRPIRKWVDYVVDSDGPGGDWGLALEAIARARLNKFRSRLMHARVKTLLAHGKTSEAKRELKSILASDPWNMEALMISAEIAFSSKQYDKAAGIYGQILELNPCQPKPYLRLLEMKKGSEDLKARAKLYCPNLKEL